MATSAPNCRSVAAAMPMLSVGTLPTANGANKPPSAAPATRSGPEGKITRMVSSNLMMSSGGARHLLDSGVTPDQLFARRAAVGIGLRLIEPVGLLAADLP